MEEENENIILTGDPGNKKNNNEPNIISLKEIDNLTSGSKKSDIDPDTIVVEPIISRKKVIKLY